MEFCVNSHFATKILIFSEENEIISVFTTIFFDWEFYFYSYFLLQPPPTQTPSYRANLIHMSQHAQCQRPQLEMTVKFGRTAHKLGHASTYSTLNTPSMYMDLSIAMVIHIS